MAKEIQTTDINFDSFTLPQVAALDLENAAHFIR